MDKDKIKRAELRLFEKILHARQITGSEQFTFIHIPDPDLTISDQQLLIKRYESSSILIVHEQTDKQYDLSLNRARFVDEFDSLIQGYGVNVVRLIKEDLKLYLEWTRLEKTHKQLLYVFARGRNPERLFNYLLAADQPNQKTYSRKLLTSDGVISRKPESGKDKQHTIDFLRTVTELMDLPKSLIAAFFPAISATTFTFQNPVQMNHQLLLGVSKDIESMKISLKGDKEPYKNRHQIILSPLY